MIIVKEWGDYVWNSIPASVKHIELCQLLPCTDCFHIESTIQRLFSRTAKRSQMAQSRTLTGSYFVTGFIFNDYSKGCAEYEMVNNQQGAMRRIGYNQFIFPASPSRIIVLSKTRLRIEDFLPFADFSNSFFCKLYGVCIDHVWLQQGYELITLLW